MNNTRTCYNYAENAFIVTTIGAHICFTFPEMPSTVYPGLCETQYLGANRLKVVQPNTGPIVQLCDENFTLFIDCNLNATDTTNITRALFVPWLLKLAGSLWVATINPPPPYTTWQNSTMALSTTQTMPAPGNWAITWNTTNLSSDITSSDNQTFTTVKPGAYILTYQLGLTNLEPIDYNAFMSQLQIMKNGVSIDAMPSWNSQGYNNGTGLAYQPLGNINTTVYLAIGDTISFNYLIRPTGGTLTLHAGYTKASMCRCTPIY